MYWTRGVGWPLLAVCAVGCGARQVEPGSLPPPRLGQHEFRAELPGGVRLAGLLVVTGDTIVPRLSDGECRVATKTPSREHFVYECAIPGTTGIMLALDRVNPVRRSTWGLTTSLRKTRSSCTAWRTWENGARTCTLSQPEEYFETVNRTGALVVLPG